MYDEADKAAFIAAADASGKEFPKDVFTLPTTRIMVAEAGEKIVLYQPHFVSLSLGSLIPAPLATNGLLAEAQHQLVAAAYTRVHTEGFADIFASSNDERTRGFAKRHGFVPWADGLRLEVR
jgi:hypothetical protein